MIDRRVPGTLPDPCLIRRSRDFFINYFCYYSQFTQYLMYMLDTILVTMKTTARMRKMVRVMAKM